MSERGFEPTYEGWKHGERPDVHPRSGGFEPTYEGWKLLIGSYGANGWSVFRAYL